MYLRIAALLMLATGLSSCGEPSENSAKTVLEKIYGGSQNVNIKSFKKINGQKSNFFGVEIYTIEYEAEIEFPNGLNIQCGVFGAPITCIGAPRKNRGETSKEKGQIQFEKTERGWKGNDGNIY